VAAFLGLGLETGARMFLFMHLRGLCSAAVRLGITGPLQAQALQHRISAAGERIWAECLELAPEQAAQTAPLLEVWQGSQDRLYSRLFQS